MELSKEALKYYGVENDDYIKWANKNGLSIYKRKTKEEFFKRLQEGKLKKNILGVLVEND